MMKLVLKAENGCWLWAGYRAPDGYGQVKAGMVHRLMYEHLVGPIPDGLVLDHLCRVRWCCNPAHLEPVTQGENLRRAPGSYVAIAAALKARTHCANGHEYTEANTNRKPNGSRQCLECAREYNRRSRDRARGRRSSE